MKGTVICDGRGDAACTTGAVGVVLTVHSEDSWNTINFEEEFAKKIDPTTNIVAEHMSIQYGIELAKIAGITELLIYNDSQVPVYQVQGKYGIKAEHLKQILEKTWELASDPHFSSVEIRWTPRENTTRADKLCREIDKPSGPQKLPARRERPVPLEKPRPRRNPFVS
jgi:ribonuclease HI